MTKRPRANVAASVHARLLNRRRETGEDFLCCFNATLRSGCSTASVSLHTATSLFSGHRLRGRLTESALEP